MKLIEELAQEKLSKRNFMQWLAKLVALSALFPVMGCSSTTQPKAQKSPLPVQTEQWKPADRQPRIVVQGDLDDRVLLQNGLIVDGTGNQAYFGDVLIRGNRIERVTPKEIVFGGQTIDCSDRVIAPGFIDAHSHMDWTLPINGHPELKTPFTQQGVTTFVGGNCGFGAAGFKADSPFKEMIQFQPKELIAVQWNTMAEYFDYLQHQGISHNLLTLAGHGFTRTSIRGFKPTALEPHEMREMLYLLEEAMDQGAAGVSLGLQYEPGIFATMDEIKQIAELVKRKDKILTVHMKAYSSLSPAYPLKLFGGRPHNLLAIEDMLNLARETGVRLQLSHLIFVGSRTWKTCGEALSLIDQAANEGIDVKFDTYVYHCGTSVINVFVSQWFLAEIPEAYDSGWALFKLSLEHQVIKSLLGFGYGDIQIIDAKTPEYESYNGMFLNAIAKKRRADVFETFIDIARKSDGRARVLNHRYSNLEVVKALMQHPDALYMTDATPFIKGVQNPATYGNFPRFLQYARDYGLISLEEAVYKMTGASAQRFRIKDRGVLKKGNFADITIFDWKNVRDNNTQEKTNQAPTGIEAVFINGKQVLRDGKLTTEARPGMVL
jgi:N-acyl-D-amino-acid deacylase